VLGLSLLCAAIFYKTDWQASVWAVGIGVACCAPFWLWKLFMVRRSIARTSALTGQQTYVSGDVQGFANTSFAAQPLPKADAPIAQAPKKKSGIGLGWKIRLALIGAGVIFAVLADNWATVDKYFPQLNSVIHSGTPTSQSDFDYHAAHLKEGMTKISEASDACDGKAFKQCQAALLGNKATLLDMRQHLEAFSDGWAKETRERSVPMNCQQAMSEFFTAWRRYLDVEDRAMVLLQSINPDSVDDIKASGPKLDQVSEQEDAATDRLNKAHVGNVCNGY
jgi:hypothetical protein